MTEEYKTPEDDFAERVRKQDEAERDARRRARGQAESPQGTAPTEPVEPATDEPSGTPA